MVLFWCGVGGVLGLAATWNDVWGAFFGGGIGAGAYTHLTLPTQRMV